MEPRSILIVANQTAAGDHLKRVVADRIERGPCRFTLLVPATPPSSRGAWTEGQATALAQRRLDEALEGLKALGAEIDGVVGDTSPIDAIGDALDDRPHDEIVLSTLPPGASRWLKLDLPHRVEKRFGLPVTHVVGR